MCDKYIQEDREKFCESLLLILSCHELVAQAKSIECVALHIGKENLGRNEISSDVKLKSII